MAICVGLLFLAIGVEPFPFVEPVRNDEATLTTPPGVAEGWLLGEFFGAHIEGRIGKFLIFCPIGSKPHRIIFATRLPSIERMATSVGAVGGLFQSASKFGAWSREHNVE